MVDRAALLSPLAKLRQTVDASIDQARQWTESSVPVLANRRRPYLVAMGGLFAAALAIGWAVLPGEIERIAALEQDRQGRRALELLEARFARGDRDSRTLVQLTRFYEVNGDTTAARRMLELLAEQRPRDAVIQRQLAQLYKATQDEPAYVNALKRQIALRYSEPACKELIGLYRRSSQYEAEQATIKDCRGKGYRRPDDLVRLAFLEAADGRLSEAAQLLRAVDDRLWLRTSRERLLLFATLVETKQEPEALRRATRWLRGQPDEDLAIDMIYKFVELDRNDLALQFATAVGRPGDAVSLAVGEIMIDQVQYEAARAFLSGWLQQNRGMDLELATRFVTAGLDAEDPALALRGAERYGLSKLPQPLLRDLAETLMADGAGRDFDRVRPALEPATIAAHPMLAAALELRGGRADLARGHLMRVRADELDERRLQHFSRLVDQAGRSPALAAVLREQRIGVVAATPGRPPLVVGSSTAEAKSRIKQRVEANKRFRERRRLERIRAAQQANTPSLPQPIPFPKND